MIAPLITIEKNWDENERVRESANGRVYVSTAGRWTWTVVVDGDGDSTHDTRRAAHARAMALRARGVR